LLAEILDNNQDGYLDDTGVVNLLQTRSTGTWMNMMSSSNEALEGEIISALGEYLGKDMGVKHSWLSAASGDAGADAGGDAAPAEPETITEEVPRRFVGQQGLSRRKYAVSNGHWLHHY